MSSLYQPLLCHCYIHIITIINSPYHMINMIAITWSICCYTASMSGHCVCQSSKYRSYHGYKLVYWWLDIKLWQTYTTAGQWPLYSSTLLNKVVQFMYIYNCTSYQYNYKLIWLCVSTYTGWYQENDDDMALILNITRLSWPYCHPQLGIC